VIDQNNVLAILFGIVLALLLVRIAHREANKRRWSYVPRYVCGALIVMVAFTPALFTTLDPPIASFLLLILGVLFATTGLRTWLEHDADHQREVAGAIAEAERLNKRIHSELEK
jgi:hypothetical protein